MALKLQSRELPTVKFRRELPSFLGPDGETCFIEIDARAGGHSNQKYQMGVERLLTRSRVSDRQISRIEDDKEHIETDEKRAKELILGKFGLIYDACIIEWRTNIQSENDDGEWQSIEPNRSNFLDLCDQRIPELGSAILDFEKEVLEAGKIQLELIEDTIKN